MESMLLDIQLTNYITAFIQSFVCLCIYLLEPVAVLRNMPIVAEGYFKHL
ncbi:hypothetical protein LCGC14_2216090, partial [marine sediment metagenome]